MVLLIVFAALAGAATALSPCILPVLPIVLGAGVTGGRRRPLGIVVGLTCSFTLATVALVYLIAALGLPDALLRQAAIAVLAAVGVMFLWPALAARVEGAISRAGARVRVPAGGGEGFGSGLAVGLALGVVYAPCAGPILAAVITTSAAQPLTGQRIAVALAYGLGTAAVLYVLMLGGRRLTRPLARHSGRLQLASGVLMIAVAAAMLAQLDLRFQSQLARHLPAALVNPTGGLERQVDAVALASLREGEPMPAGAAARDAARPVAERDALPDLGPAPEFTGTQRWFNTPGGQPLTLAGLRGKVVLVDFWTYSCINCLRTLPALKEYDRRYRDDGLVVVGVHAPEFPFERDEGNVADAIEREGLRYAVAQDNEFATWNAFHNRFWPSVYLIDARGRLRYYRPGEGGYAEKDAAIRALLAERGGRVLHTGRSSPSGPAASAGELTAERYLGTRKITRLFGVRPGADGAIRAAVFPTRLPTHGLAFSGSWQLGENSATAGSEARLRMRVRARKVFVVAGRRGGGSGRLQIKVNGRPVRAAQAGADVRRQRVDVDATRLYELVDVGAVRESDLELVASEGVQLYAFTFG